MNVKISSLAEQTAKCVFIAAVLASFVFFGWRVMTKRAYVEHERAQCEALAVSAALTAAEAVSKDEPLAQLVKEFGEAEFVTDHMSMPGNNTVSVTIGAEQGGRLFLVLFEKSAVKLEIDYYAGHHLLRGELPHGIQQRCRAVPIHPLAASGRIGQHLAPHGVSGNCAVDGIVKVLSGVRHSQHHRPDRLCQHLRRQH